MITRRALLAAAALAAGCAAPPRQVPTPFTAPPTTIPDAAPPVQVRRALSRARGTDVRMVVATPGDVPAADLPVCLVLHGSGDTADVLVDLGAPAALAAAATPFALVAVDGGDSGWRPVPGDDPAAMLASELPAGSPRRAWPRPRSRCWVSATPPPRPSTASCAPAPSPRRWSTRCSRTRRRVRNGCAPQRWPSGPAPTARPRTSPRPRSRPAPLGEAPIHDVVAFLADHARAVRGGY
ncbi:hypothetical protein ACFQV2_21900 [Actinokineospora soli]|uniref:Esterase n=1 Tax=Actinokineospora soli TaxID=1048753 RepID=A0ABW2TRX5_9PSEU